MNIKAEIDATLFVASLSTCDLSMLKAIVESEFAKRIELDKEKKMFLWSCIVQLWPHDELELTVEEFRNKTFIPYIKKVREKYGMSLKDAKQLVESFYQIILPKFNYDITLSDIQDRLTENLTSKS